MQPGLRKQLQNKEDVGRVSDPYQRLVVVQSCMVSCLDTRLIDHLESGRSIMCADSRRY